MLRWAIPIGILLLTLGAIPLGFIAKARVGLSDKPRYHVIKDMDQQEKHKAQAENDLFADKRAMRMPVPGTVARGELYEDDHYWRGQVKGKDGKLTWATTFPLNRPLADGSTERFEVNDALLARGKQRYEIFCSMCHGYSGHGDGLVHERVTTLKTKGMPGVDGWAQPASYHTEQLNAAPVGDLFNTISYGKNNMAGYRNQIPTEDRWAIVAYLRALQLSQKPLPKKTK